MSDEKTPLARGQRAAATALDKLIRLELLQRDAARYDRVAKLARVGKVLATLHGTRVEDLQEQPDDGGPDVIMGGRLQGPLRFDNGAQQADLHREVIATLRPIAEAAERLRAILPPVEAAPVAAEANGGAS